MKVSERQGECYKLNSKSMGGPFDLHMRGEGWDSFGIQFEEQGRRIWTREKGMQVR